MQLYLMHEDNQVALFNTNDLKDMQLINVELLPFLPWAGSTDKRFLLRQWIKERCIQITRKGYKSDAKGQPIDIAFHNLGVSLTDHYWYKPVNSNYTWSNINPFTNDFESSPSLEAVYADAKNYRQDHFNPSATLLGNVKKKWIIDSQGNRVLLKGNELSTQQVFNELFACELCKRLGFKNYVTYTKQTMTTNGQEIIGSACKCMTDINTELIHAYEILLLKHKNDVSHYQFYISYCSEHGIDIDELKYNIDMSIIVDFLMTNDDRHCANFGILRDAKTFKFLKPAPLFDTGNSMFWNMDIPLNSKELFKLNIKGFCKHELKLLKLLSRRDYNLDNLPSASDVYDFYKESVPDIAAKIASWYNVKMTYLKKNVIVSSSNIDHYGITPTMAKAHSIDFNDVLACKALSEKIMK